jgi:hypothetical protein
VNTPLRQKSLFLISAVVAISLFFSLQYIRAKKQAIPTGFFDRYDFTTLNEAVKVLAGAAEQLQRLTCGQDFVGDLFRKFFTGFEFVQKASPLYDYDCQSHQTDDNGGNAND